VVVIVEFEPGVAAAVDVDARVMNGFPIVMFMFSSASVDCRT
jgi:hypothetical protein